MKEIHVRINEVKSYGIHTLLIKVLYARLKISALTDATSIKVRIWMVKKRMNFGLRLEYYELEASCK
ncbi:hypothetical protein RCL_jg23028.t1 [Rhizophagus clarus]|uniref:Uncharacterized protein n=1 Tax=Rhizophagus clarus TaxID=94130 RepID=A0A8H3L761_9GLOM|nr:hypothetical protein RCL_jg23028.t1 [Rhizophagus clarus]